MADSNNNKPAHEIRIGHVKATIWANKSERGNRFNVTVQRLYKAESGWKSTSSFGRDDLPLIGKVADMAHTWIFEQKAQ